MHVYGYSTMCETDVFPIRCCLFAKSVQRQVIQLRGYSAQNHEWNPLSSIARKDVKDV